MMVLTGVWRGQVGSSFEESYPNIAHWVRLQGWIELGQDHYSSSLVRALDEGGMIWEASAHYETVDEALDALESALTQWMEQNA
jgi:hypothetical protein